jgi:hypothetical protein
MLLEGIHWRAPDPYGPACRLSDERDMKTQVDRYGSEAPSRNYWVGLSTDLVALPDDLMSSSDIIGEMCGTRLPPKPHRSTRQHLSDRVSANTANDLRDGLIVQILLADLWTHCKST